MKPPRRLSNAMRANLGLLLLLAAVFVVGACYAIATPLFEVSDELWHYPMVKTLADGDGLPVQDPSNPMPWRQEGSQPPLYYALMAAATFWIDTSDMDAVRWINPHADNGVITADGNNNIVIHTQREAWPWHGTVLAVRLIRLLSVLMGVGTVAFTYLLALQVIPGRRGLALAAGAFAGFTPMFLFISASVNNDNLAILLSAAALWMMARWVRGSAAPRGWQPAVLGIVLGAAALSKSSALGLWPLAGAALVWAEGRRAWEAGWRPTGAKGLLAGLWNGRVMGWDVRPAALQAAVMAGLAALVSGWWFVRNYALYGDWLGWSAFLATVGQRPHPASLSQIWGERVGFVQAYWGLFGGVSVAMPGWAYAALNLSAGLAIIGLGWGLLQALRRRKFDATQAALWALLLAWVVLILVGLVRWTSLTWASQGRLIFPAISAISVLAVWGLDRLWRGLPMVVVAGMAVLAAAVPFTVIGPHYQPPPPLTPAQVAAIPFPLEAGQGVDFGGEMRLLGYNLQDDAARPGEALRLTLYWQSQIAMDRNWSIFVHVVDEAEVIVAQRDRYPGMGALATTLLVPGQTFADDYVIHIPGAAYSPVSARLVVGLYDLIDGARLPVATGADSLTLADVEIAARPEVRLGDHGPIPNPIQTNFGNQIELAGYHMDRRSLVPGETLRVTLYWRAIGRIPINYSVFAHVRGEGETLWAGQDAWPQQGAAPTVTWQPGDLIMDSYELTLKPDTLPGLHDVEVGIYDSETGVRLRVMDPARLPTDADYIFLSRIRVGLP